LGLHCHAVNTHPDELVLVRPSKKILDPPMVVWRSLEALLNIVLHGLKRRDRCGVAYSRHTVFSFTAVQSCLL